MILSFRDRRSRDFARGHRVKAFEAVARRRSYRSRDFARGHCVKAFEAVARRRR